MQLLILTAIAVAIFLYLAGPLKEIAISRNYRSGSRWAFWRWTRVASDYILRLHILKTPWFAACLHWINKPDAEPWLHDHPVSFLSIILRGGYAEMRQRGGKPFHKVNRWFNFVRASDKDRHRIILVRKNTLTLCFMGPKTREWGFHMPEGGVGWKDYYARLKAGEDMRDVFVKCEEQLARENVVWVQPVKWPSPGGVSSDCMPSEDFLRKAKLPYDAGM